MDRLLFFDALNPKCHDGVEEPQLAFATWMLLEQDWFGKSEILAGVHQVIQESRGRIKSRVHVLAEFEFLPVMLVRATDEQVGELQNEKSLRYIVSQKFNPSYCLGVLRGLNALRSQTGYQVYQWSPYVQRGGLLPTDSFEGGLWPASAYPDFNGESSNELVCPPAWIPVINISMGTFLNDAANPVLFAVDYVSRTHLVVLAAGNSGRSPVNSFAGYSGICVGATSDPDGERLADYSSTSSDELNSRCIDVVAYGGSFSETPSGTSFAAPRVSILGCVYAALIFQLERLWRWKSGRPKGGVPLVGWGLIDHLNGLNYLPRRKKIDATPFLQFEPSTEEAFSALCKSNCDLEFTFDPKAAKELIVSSARPMEGYSENEVGKGFVSDLLFLDFLTSLSLGKILQPFLTDKAKSIITTTCLNSQFVNRLQLQLLMDFVRESAPCWVYDYHAQTFSVNRSSGTELPPDGMGHAHKVIAAANNPFPRFVQ